MPESSPGPDAISMRIPPSIVSDQVALFDVQATFFSLDNPILFNVVPFPCSLLVSVCVGSIVRAFQNFAGALSSVLALVMDPIIVAFVPRTCNEKHDVANYLLFKLLFTVLLSRKYLSFQRFVSPVINHALDSKLKIALVLAVIRPWLHSVPTMLIPFEAGLICVRSYLE